MKIEDNDLITCMNILRAQGVVGTAGDAIHSINTHASNLYNYARSICPGDEDDSLSCELGMLKHLLCLKYFVDSDQHALYEFQPTGTLSSVSRENYNDLVEYNNALHGMVVDFLATIGYHHVGPDGVAMLNSLIYSVWLTLIAVYTPRVIHMCISGHLKISDNACNNDEIIRKVKDGRE